MQDSLTRMRSLLAALSATCLLISCQPSAPVSSTRANQYNVEAPVAKLLPTTDPAPQTLSDTRPPTISPKNLPTLTSASLSRKTISGIQFEGVIFDSRTYKLSVVDQPDGPGSRYATSQDVASATSSLVAINAGFFTPEGAPLGLVISSGNTSGAWNSASSLGTGVYHESSSGFPEISRRTSRSAVSSSRELLQAGPLLVENNRRIGGLSSEKSAVRSILLTDGSTRWWIGKTSSCTLSALGDALSSASPASWKVKTALNLDGGRSTDLYVSSGIPGGPINRRGFLNRPVRNFFILKKRQ